jgi:cellobiose phosphorylase
VRRKFRGATYEIAVKNPNKVMRGIASLTVDGNAIQGDVIPLISAGGTYKVNVVMG